MCRYPATMLDTCLIYCKAFLTMHPLPFTSLSGILLPAKVGLIEFFSCFLKGNERKWQYKVWHHLHLVLPSNITLVSVLFMGGGEGGWNIRTSIALQYTVFLNLFYDREVIIILNYPKDLHNTKHENEILPNKILSFLILKKICFHLT